MIHMGKGDDTSLSVSLFYPVSCIMLVSTLRHWSPYIAFRRIETDIQRKHEDVIRIKTPSNTVAKQCQGTLFTASRAGEGCK